MGIEPLLLGPRIVTEVELLELEVLRKKFLTRDAAGRKENGKQRKSAGFIPVPMCLVPTDEWNNMLPKGGEIRVSGMLASSKESDCLNAIRLFKDSRCC